MSASLAGFLLRVMFGTRSLPISQLIKIKAQGKEVRLVVALSDSDSGVGSLPHTLTYSNAGPHGGREGRAHGGREGRARLTCQLQPSAHSV